MTQIAHACLVSLALLVPDAAGQCASSDDVFEDNDTCATAAPITLGLHTDLNVEFPDFDFYSFEVPALHTVTLTYVPETFGVAPAIASSGCRGPVMFVGSSGGSDQWTNYAPVPIEIEIRVLPPFDDCTIYTLELSLAPFVSPEVGTGYCTSLPNHTGGPAVIVGYGTGSIAANDLTLVVVGARKTQPGIFIGGMNQQEVPFGNGFLCMSDPHRMLPVQVADGAGTLLYGVDYDELAATAFEVVAGATWNFQSWYRDPGGPTPFNFSDGLSITFQP